MFVEDLKKRRSYGTGTVDMDWRIAENKNSGEKG